MSIFISFPTLGYTTLYHHTPSCNIFRILHIIQYMKYCSNLQFSISKFHFVLSRDHPLFIIVVQCILISVCKLYTTLGIPPTHYLALYLENCIIQYMKYCSNFTIQYLKISLCSIQGPPSVHHAGAVAECILIFNSYPTREDAHAKFPCKFFLYCTAFNISNTFLFSSGNTLCSSCWCSAS